MEILLINVPSRRGRGGMMVPLGLLYVGGIIERSGHSVKIFDPYSRDPELVAFDHGEYSQITEIIESYRPKIIGFGGVASSYGRTKKLSEYIHKNFPNIFQIAGGALSSTYELLLTKTKVNLVFHGETETTFPQFLEKFEKNNPLEDINGISFRKGDIVVKNPLAPQIENLDTIPFPSYHLVKLEDYFISLLEVMNCFKSDVSSDFNYANINEILSSDGLLMPIMSSRGCTNKCSFCYRHMKGYRQHSVDYVVKHIKFLKSQYKIRGFDFAEELFNFDKKWVLDFCDAIEQENLDIYYRVLGARVDRIDKEMLQRLKDTGCVYIAYGQESGSETILKEYKKGVSPQKNKEITCLSKECGLICPVQIVIGSPGETQKTINETIQFLIDVNAGYPSLNYLLPFPETPIWEYVKENNLIPDTEGYLDEVAECGGSPIVNLTSIPDHIWMNWGAEIQYELKLNNYRRNGKILHYVILYPLIKILNFTRPYIPKKVITSLIKIRH
ncbi:MAG: radical SAM protein [Methanoregula sp.]